MLLPLVFACDNTAKPVVQRKAEDSTEINLDMPQGVSHEERKVYEDEWYVLYERPIDGDTSEYRIELFKTDAQLGLSIAIEIARLAKSRGFDYILCSDYEQSPITVDFHVEKPIDVSGSMIFEADALISISDAG